MLNNLLLFIKQWALRLIRNKLKVVFSQNTRESMRKQTRRAETQVSKPRELSEEIKCTIYINLVIVDHLREKIYDERVYIYINYIDIYMNPLEEKRPRIRPLDVARARLPKSTLHTHIQTHVHTNMRARIPRLYRRISGDKKNLSSKQRINIKN